MPLPIGVSLEKDSTQGKFGSINGDSEWCSKVGKMEYRI